MTSFFISSEEQQKPKKGLQCYNVEERKLMADILYEEQNSKRCMYVLGRERGEGSLSNSHQHIFKSNLRLKFFLHACDFVLYRFKDTHGKKGSLVLKKVIALLYYCNAFNLFSASQYQK